MKIAIRISTLITNYANYDVLTKYISNYNYQKVKICNYKMNQITKKVSKYTIYLNWIDLLEIDNIRDKKYPNLANEVLNLIEKIECFKSRIELWFDNPISQNKLDYLKKKIMTIK